MAASSMQSAQAQLAIDRLALSQVEERRATVAAALAAAMETLHQARNDIDALTPELETLTTKASRLRYNVCDQRAILLRRMFEVLPAELLRAIFLELVHLPDRMWAPGQARGTFNKRRALAPFTLSAVCRRWRTLALATSDLWTYVGVSAIDRHPGSAKPQYRYVLTVLERSKSRPLDIMLDWFYSGDSRWDSSPYYRHILRALTEHAGRWKRLQIEFPADTPKRQFSAFRHPTPVLEELHVLCVTDDDCARWTSRSPNYLPYCPRLRRLIADKLFVVASEPMPALTFLSINATGIPVTAVEDLLRMTPSLEILALSFPTESFDPVPNVAAPAPISLPELVELTIDGNMDFFPAWATGIQCPKLRRLHIEAIEIPALSAFFVLEDLRITDLHIDCPDETRLSSTAAAQLAHLSHLRSITIDECANFGASFFASLAPPCWPHIEVVKLKDVLLKDDAAEALVQFIRARKRVLPDEPEASAHAPIRVELVNADVPAWLGPQLRTVAAECVVGNGEISDSSSDEESSDLSEDESSD